MRYRVITVNEDNWHVIKSSNVYNAPSLNKFKPIYELIKSVDTVIFYIKKEGF